MINQVLAAMMSWNKAKPAEQAGNRLDEEKDRAARKSAPGPDKPKR